MARVYLWGAFLVLVLVVVRGREPRRPAEPRPVTNKGAAPATAPPAAALLFGERLDLNAAGLEDLQALPGIGPTLAARIVVERARRGGFSDPAELGDVPGIGDATLAELLPYVRVGPRGPP